MENYDDIDYDKLNKKLDEFGKIYTRDLKVTI
jgi:hypothetical protein